MLVLHQQPRLLPPLLRSSTLCSPARFSRFISRNDSLKEIALGNSGFLFPVCTFSDYDTNYDWSVRADITDGGEEGARASNVVFVSGDCCALLLLAH